MNSRISSSSLEKGKFIHLLAQIHTHMHTHIYIHLLTHTLTNAHTYPLSLTHLPTYRPELDYIWNTLITGEPLPTTLAPFVLRKEEKLNETTKLVINMEKFLSFW